MQILFVLIVGFFHALAVAADDGQEENLSYMYWASSIPPEIVFAQGISPTGESDNVQQLALNVNCLATHDLQGSALIEATEDRFRATGEKMAMSAMNRNRDLYIYSIAFYDDWLRLDESLESVYPGQQDMRTLALVHRDRRTRVLRGPVPSTHVYRARHYRDGTARAPRKQSIIRCWNRYVGALSSGL